MIVIAVFFRCADLSLSLYGGCRCAFVLPSCRVRPALVLLLAAAWPDWEVRLNMMDALDKTLRITSIAICRESITAASSKSGLIRRFDYTATSD